MLSTGESLTSSAVMSAQLLGECLTSAIVKACCKACTLSVSSRVGRSLCVCHHARSRDRGPS